MINPIVKIFEFGDGQDHDASVDEISEVFEACNNYTWLLVPESTGLDASPTYSFESSNSATGPWGPYDPLTEDANILQPFDDNHMAPTHFRINYSANGNTTGTVKFTITLKR